MEAKPCLQIVAFMEQLSDYRAMQPLHPSTMRSMAALYGLDGSRNAEIKAAWLRLGLNAGTTFMCISS